MLRARTVHIWHKSWIPTVRGDGKQEHCSCTSKWDWSNDLWNGVLENSIPGAPTVIVFKMVVKQRAFCKSFPNHPLENVKAEVTRCKETELQWLTEHPPAPELSKEGSLFQAVGMEKWPLLQSRQSINSRVAMHPMLNQTAQYLNFPSGTWFCCYQWVFRVVWSLRTSGSERCPLSVLEHSGMVLRKDAMKASRLPRFPAFKKMLWDLKNNIYFSLLFNGNDSVPGNKSWRLQLGITLDGTGVVSDSN